MLRLIAVLAVLATSFANSAHARAFVVTWEGPIGSFSDPTGVFLPGGGIVSDLNMKVEMVWSGEQMLFAGPLHKQFYVEEGITPDIYNVIFYIGGRTVGVKPRAGWYYQVNDPPEPTQPFGDTTFMSGFEFSNFSMILGITTFLAPIDPLEAFSMPGLIYLDGECCVETGLMTLYGDAFGGIEGPPPMASLSRISSRPIPEPTTWALSIVGFGLAAVALRRRSTYCTA